MQIILQGQVMHVGQIILPIYIVMRLQAAQGGAIFAKIFFAQARDFRARNVHTLIHVGIHAILDGQPQPAGRWIKRIIEIKEDRCKTHWAIIIAICLFACFRLKLLRKSPPVK